MLDPIFADALGTFVQTTQAKLDADYARFGSTSKAPTLTSEVGLKNVRIVSNGQGQRSVFCFIRIADGAVLKAAGWKAPAKHARGSIYTNAGQDALTTYGAVYLR